MKSQSQDIWLDSCNLCGSVDYQQLSYRDSTLYRCRVCGLVQHAVQEESEPDERLLDLWFFESTLKNLSSKKNSTRPVSILLIGSLSEEELAPFEAPYVSLKNHAGRIESASFHPEEFDMILCARSMESFSSPSALFMMTRLWLRPGGLFVAGGANWESLERRINTHRWIELYSSGRYYLGYGHMRQYAMRYGFEITSSGTASSLPIIASILYGSDSILKQIGAIPVRLAAILPRLGSTWWSVLVKRSLATRPLLNSPLERVERTAGLATAGFRSVSREMVERN